MPEVTVPPSWRVVSRLAPIQVSSPEPVVGFVTIRVGRSSTAGFHSVRVGFTDEARPEQTGFGDVAVSVPSISGIGLALQNPPRFVRAGERVEIPLMVTNNGNLYDQIHLDATGPMEANLRLDSSRVHLGPAETRLVRLVVETDSRLSLETIYDLYIHARSGKNRETFESLATRLHVIPGYGELNQRRATQPLNVSLQSVGDETGGSGQIGARTRLKAFGGDLDLEMLLTNRQNTPMFGSRETYRAAYSSSHLDLRLGDQTQQQSPLTSRGDFGAGVGLEVKSDAWSASGFGQRSRYRFPRENLMGGSLAYQPSDATRLSLNGVHRDGSYGGTAVTARGELRPFGANQNLDLECGIDAGQGVERPSCSAELRLAGKGLSYQGRIASLSDTYPGYQQGTLERNARVTYRLPAGVGVEASWRSQETNLLSSIRSVENRQLGTSFSRRMGPLRAFTRANFSTRNWDYQAGDVAIDRFERSLRLQQGFDARSLNVHATVDFGRSKSLARGYDGSGIRYQGSVRYAPSRSLSLSIIGEQASGYLNGSTRPTERRMLNLRGRGKLGGSTDLALSLYRNVLSTSGSEALRYSTYRASLKQRLRGGHEITMQAQVSEVPNSTPGYAADYQLSYSFPLHVPVGKPSDQRVLVGRIYDADSGAGIEGVLVLMGSTASLTDPDGWFEVLRPDDYVAFLSLDQRSIGYESVSLVSMPLEISPQEELPAILEIPIARAATLTGRVSVFGSSAGGILLGDSGPQVEVSGLGNVVLGLVSGSNEYRTRTGPTGRYEFKNVAPGDYELKVVAHQRLEDHVFETRSESVQLLSGASEALNLRVVPRRPRIRMMSSEPRVVVLDAPQVTELAEDAPRPTLVDESSPSPGVQKVGSGRAASVGGPEWLDDANFAYNITLPLYSQAKVEQAVRRLGQMGYQTRIETSRGSSDHARTARPFRGEGILNLLKRNGLSGTEENLSRFQELNKGVLGGRTELRQDEEYILPDADIRPPTHIVLVGQFRSYSGAATAVREVAPASTWRAHITPQD